MIERILKYVDENYDNTLEKSEIEDLVCCSQRNSQRLFKRFFNETISNFKKRLKLENAYKNLIYSKESIKNIAYDVGYENQSSFCKAFTKHFNISPTEARANKELLFTSFFQQNDTIKKKLEYELVSVPSKQVYCKLILTNNYSSEAINEHWNLIEEETQGILNANYYGLILDEPLISNKSKCRYEACIDIKSNSPNYLPKDIFGKKYLKFSHLNEFDLMEETYQQIFYNWIYFLDYEIDNSPIIEHYIQDKTVQNKSGYRTEIYVPIKLSF